MAYDPAFADRIRKTLKGKRIKEKEMMGGLTFMVNGKMCVGIFKGELMCRVDPALTEDLVEKPGCRQMQFGGRSMKGYLLLDETAIKTQKALEFWIGHGLDFNKHAKSSKKKK